MHRFAGADGIRGFACLTVLLAHIPGFFFQSVAGYFSGTGKYGVWLFFVLSAFLLTSRFVRSGLSAPTIISYSLGRVLRIIPIFIVVALVYWGAKYAGVMSTEDFIRLITFQAGYAHLWTIPVEFKFYFALPFIAFALIWCNEKYGLGAATVVTVLMVVLHQLAWPYWNTPANSIDTAWYLPSFFIGCYAAIIVDPLSKRISSAVSTLIGVGVLVAFLVLSPGGRLVLLGMPLDGWLMDKFIPLSFLWALFVVALADGKGVIGSILKTGFLRRMGAWSYSIYLIHWFFYQWLSSISHGVFFAAAALLCTVATGAIMFRFIESPIERFRHQLQSRITSRNQVIA